MTVNLVEREHIDHFKSVVATGYQRETGMTPEIYVCSAVKGAEK